MADDLIAAAWAVHQRHAAVAPEVRGARVPYQRRGVLSIPAFRLPAGGDPQRDGRAASLRLMAAARTTDADAFFFDLEDAAPDQPEFKLLAREFCIEALRGGGFGDRVVGFRPNDVRSPLFAADLVDVVAACGDRLDFIVVPKTERAAEVADIAALVRDLARTLGLRRPPALEVLIESPRALLEAAQIAACDGVAALVFGAWDFARCLGAEVDAETWLGDYAAARQTIAACAAAHGKDAIDAVTATLPLRPRDPDRPTDAEVARRTAALDSCARDARDARRLGFAAKWILHPDQVAPIQAAWDPSRAAALAALAACADYARARHAGSGARVDRGQLVDKAVAGAAFWVVRAGLRSGVIGPLDLKAVGVTHDELRAAAGAAGAIGAAK